MPNETWNHNRKRADALTTAETQVTPVQIVDSSGNVVSLFGGGSGSASVGYQGTSQTDAGDFKVTRTSATQLTLSEIPFHLLQENIVSVHEYDGDNLLASYLHSDTDYDFTWTPGADKSGGTLDVVTATFGAASTFTVVVTGPPRDTIDVMTDFAGSGVHQSPRDFAAAYASGTTIDITGMDMDPDVDDIRAVVEVGSTGAIRMTYTRREWAFSWAAGVAGAGTLTIANATLQAGSTLIVFIEGPERGTKRADTAPSAALRVVPVQPIDENGDVIEGGSGGAGGGMAIYSALQNDCSLAYTAATQVTVTGLPFTLATPNFIQVDVWDSSGVKVTYKPDANGFSFNPATGVLTVTDATFAATDIGYDVLFWGPPKGYDQVGDQLVTHITNPVWEQNDRATLADVTNGTDGTYEYYVDMDGFTTLGLMFTLDGGSGTATVKIFGTWEDGADITALSYRDLTSSTFGVASITADDEWIDNARKLSTCTYVYVQVVAATGDDTADWTIEAKKLFM